MTYVTFHNTRSESTPHLQTTAVVEYINRKRKSKRNMMNSRASNKSSSCLLNQSQLKHKQSSGGDFEMKNSKFTLGEWVETIIIEMSDDIEKSIDDIELSFNRVFAKKNKKAATSKSKSSKSRATIRPQHDANQPMRETIISDVVLIDVNDNQIVSDSYNGRGFKIFILYNYIENKTN